MKKTTCLAILALLASLSSLSCAGLQEAVCDPRVRQVFKTIELRLEQAADLADRLCLNREDDSRCVAAREAKEEITADLDQALEIYQLFCPDEAPPLEPGLAPSMLTEDEARRILRELERVYLTE